MPIKYIGMVFLFFSFCYLGYGLAGRYKRQVRELSAFIQLIEHIKGRINYFSSPLGEIFGSFKNDALSESGFCEIAKKENFIIALDKCKKTLSLDDKILTILYEFGQDLGSKTKEEEVGRCEYYGKILTSELFIYKNEEPKKTKLYTTLGITAGIMLIIILI